MSRSRGLPSPTAATPLTQVLDTLTDPGIPGAPGTSDTSDSSVTWDTQVTGDSGDTSGAPVSPGTSGPSGVLDTSGTSGKPKPVARDHVKLRRDLAAEMRNAVWFLTEHGRPRVQLGELLDEAIETWLAEAKKTHNEGQDFPHRGRLR
jgi:hypothetical protein